PAAARRRHVLSMVIAALIGVALFGAFRVGVLRNVHSTIADGSWGRVQFAIGAAITSMAHGGYGYTMSEVIGTVFAYAGLTGDPVVLGTVGATFPDNLRNSVLIDRAIKKAVEFTFPFNPNERVVGSSGEDVGAVDYVRLSFLLFGYKTISFYLTY